MTSSSSRPSFGGHEKFVFSAGLAQKRVADWQGNPLPASFRRDEVMRLIRCLPDTPKAPFDEYPKDDHFDKWVECSRQKWAEDNKIPAQRLQIVCALGLV